MSGKDPVAQSDRPHTPENTTERPLPQSIEASIGSTPQKHSNSSWVPSSNLTAETASLQASLAEEMVGKIIGPMPAENFLDRFLPVDIKVPECKNVFNKLIDKSEIKIEKDMYPKFVRFSLLAQFRDLSLTHASHRWRQHSRFVQISLSR